jgi:hypothetical protein
MKTTFPTLALLLTAEFVLMYAVFFVLGSSIHWPASLRLPAADSFALITAHLAEVQMGYFLYLIAALVLIPVSLYLFQLAPQGPLVQLSTIFGLVSGFFKTLGIIRWLFAIPYLVARWPETTSEEGRQAIALVYDVLNLYMGKVGEYLGVQFFAGLWLLLLSAAFFFKNTLPRWVNLYGLAVGLLLLAGTLELFFPLPKWLLLFNGMAVTFWYLMVAGVALRKASKS